MCLSYQPKPGRARTGTPRLPNDIRCALEDRPRWKEAPQQCRMAPVFAATVILSAGDSGRDETAFWETPIALARDHRCSGSIPAFNVRRAMTRMSNRGSAARDKCARSNDTPLQIHTHFRPTKSVPNGSKSAFECHSCLLVSVDYPRLENS